MNERMISTHNYEGYADPTPFLAVRNIARREVELVKPGGVYEYAKQNGNVARVLVLAKNAKSATVLLLRNDDSYGAVKINDGDYASVGMLSYAFVSNLGKHLYDLTDAEYDHVKTMLVEWLNLPAAAPATADMTCSDPVEQKQRTGRVGAFEDITQRMVDLYEAKNHDYGNAFAEMRSDFPDTVMIYLTAKLNRLKTLMKGEQAQVAESIEDTLLDLANYAIMELVERRYD